MNFQLVVISGRLTRDFELRYTNGGTAVTSNSMALNRTYGKGEDKKEDVTFVDFTAFGRQAEVLAEYSGKGATCLIKGRLQNDTWENEAGEKRSKLIVIAEEVQLGPKSNKATEKVEKVESDYKESDETSPF